MNINRHNYEEYFLLYTDKELSAAERKAVEQFVQENPDLEVEFSLLIQATLKPDDNIVFESKELLMQPVSHNFIHADNCEQLFILYADRELSSGEKAGVEKFVYDNPQYQELFELLQSVKLSPDLSLIFADKKSLYRHEKTKKPIVLSWWKVAAAALVLLFAGIVWLNDTPSLKPHPRMARASKTTVPGEANATHEKNTGNTKVDLSAPRGGGLIDSINASANLVHSTKEIKDRNKHEFQAAGARNVKSNNIAQANSRDKIVQGNKKPLVTSVVNEPDKYAGMQVGNTIKRDPVNEAMAINILNSSALNNKEIKSQAEINNGLNAAGDYRNEAVTASLSNNENVIFANIAIDRKNSLRGFFRKASRFIDKTTSYKPAKKSGLAIGNIEIAFQ